MLPRARTLVALSGGPDSTALLLVLEELGIDVVAAHFDHALRPESGHEAERVACLCRDIEVPLVSGRRTEPLAPGSRPAAARAARYAFLERARQEAGAEVIAVAHTADDVVEGVLLHLERGAGLAGMRGVPRRRGRIVRPLLDAWRDEIEKYLAERAIEPLRDPSNQDPSYARVRVRLHLIPALERSRPGITRRIHAAAMAAERLYESLTREVLNHGERSASAAVRMDAYRRLYAQAGGAEPGLGRRHLAGIDRLATGGRIDLPGGLVARRQRGRTTVEPALAEPAPRWELITSECAGCEDPDALHLVRGTKLTVGSRRPGLRLRPLPHGRTRKLQDVLVDAHVPRHLRDSLPIVFANGEPAWIPGVAIDARHLAEPGQEAVHVEVRARRDGV